MSIEEIIRAWKEDEQNQHDQHGPESPVGYEISDEELVEVVGGDQGMPCLESNTCSGGGASKCIITGSE